jgi:hypothetical protein
MGLDRGVGLGGHHDHGLWTPMGRSGFLAAFYPQTTEKAKVAANFTGAATAAPNVRYAIKC